MEKVYIEVWDIMKDIDREYAELYKQWRTSTDAKSIEIFKNKMDATSRILWIIINNYLHPNAISWK